MPFKFQRRHLLFAVAGALVLLLVVAGHYQRLFERACFRGFHGLKQTVPQAEGVALDDDGTVYIVSEPNLFYVFKKPEMAE
jgi:uncharacterized protein YjiK